MSSIVSKLLIIFCTPRGKYKYIGNDPKLMGHTALGELRETGFVIQIDDISHPWSRGWYLGIRKDWELLERN